MTERLHGNGQLGRREAKHFLHGVREPRAIDEEAPRLGCRRAEEVHGFARRR